MDSQTIEPKITYKETNAIKLTHELIEASKKEDEKKKIVDAPKYTSEELLSCLYFIFDAMERCGLDFFLVRQTARDAITNIFGPLTGDKVTIGIRKNEWQNDQKDLLFPYFEQEHVETVSELPDSYSFKWRDIPFTIFLYDDNPCLTALVDLVYQNENWKIPNRFDIFEAQYDK